MPASRLLRYNSLNGFNVKLMHRKDISEAEKENI